MMENIEPSLDDLRREIDRLDDNLHDLLIQRTAIVEKIGSAKGGGGVYLRPSRQAEILRRLVARHHGRFSKLHVVRLWNEVMGALVALQGPFSLAVFMPERGAGYLELARDQYGAYTPSTAYRSVGQVVRAVADGVATVGILPMPDREGVEPWWVSLMAENAEIPRIIARLPFASPASGRGDNLEAVAIARLTQEPTGYDRSWLVLETADDVSRARLRAALGAAGLEPTQLAATQRAGDTWLHLAEISSYVAPDDRRVHLLMDRRQPVQRAVIVGGYAVPLRPEDLSD